MLSPELIRPQAYGGTNHEPLKPKWAKVRQ